MGPTQPNMPPSVSAVTSFDKSALKKTETVVKDTLPTAADIAAESRRTAHARAHSTSRCSSFSAKIPVQTSELCTVRLPELRRNFSFLSSSKKIIFYTKK